MTDVASNVSELPTPRGKPDAWGWASLLLGTLIVLHLIVLRYMGRIWWCACGWANPIGHGGEHNSQHLLDWYTPSHLLHGVIFFWLLGWLARSRAYTTRLVLAGIIEVVWEFVENTPLVIDRYRAATTAVSYYGDSIANSVSDVLWCLIGCEAARRIGLLGSIALFLFFELLTLLLIRDNLTLNVVMLLFPIDAIRQWQGR